MRHKYERLWLAVLSPVIIVFVFPEYVILTEAEKRLIIFLLVIQNFKIPSRFDLSNLFKLVLSNHLARE